MLTALGLSPELGAGTTKLYMDDKTTREKTLDTVSHQGSANQSHNEVPLHTLRVTEE